jgi:hypothetical protein
MRWSSSARKMRATDPLAEWLLGSPSLRQRQAHHLRGGRMSPREWERRTGLRLRFVYRRMGPSLLVAEARLNARGRVMASRSRTGRGVATVPIFLVVPQVRLPKRLDLPSDAARAHDTVPGLIVTNWVEGRVR